MESQAIDAQFDRAVQIVQSLPKTGPIQTGYEEKLAMYSLFKQATVGNVKGARPAMWDMLARAKWDAWDKHKDTSAMDAKWMYVDELMRVLRKYPDKTVAQDLVKELEAYESPARDSYLQGESDSDSDSEAGHLRGSRPVSQSFQDVPTLRGPDSGERESDSDEEEEAKRVVPLLQAPPIMQNPQLNQSLLGRPQSSLSTHRYRTPMGSLVMTPPPASHLTNTAYPSSSTTQAHIYQQPHQPFFSSPQHSQHSQHTQVPGHPSSVFVQPRSVHHVYASPGQSTTVVVPSMQPMPNIETPSAFPGPSPPPSSHSMLPSTSGLSASGMSSFTHVTNPYASEVYDPAYNGSSHHSMSPSAGRISGSNVVFGPVRNPLERAIENVQAHLTALQERMDIIEGRIEEDSPYSSRQSLPGPSGAVQRSPTHGSPFSSYYGLRSGRGGENGFLGWLMNIDEDRFSWENMGLWSGILKPLAKITKFLAHILAFLISRRSSSADGRKGLSPGLAILRRLLLDASFIIFAIVVGRKLWRRSGVRRREVVHALGGVWRAMLGSGSIAQRQLVDRGVQIST